MIQFSNYTRPLLIIILLFVSWSGALDVHAARVNGDSIFDAAVIYGVARSINGAISVIQSGEIEFGFVFGSGSVRPGEWLDPLNDLIERFSSVMAWSLGSLALQKILLSIFSSDEFKYGFNIFGIVTFMFFIFTLFFGQSIESLKVLNRRVWACFLFVASLRFSIAIICVLTAALDSHFLEKREQASLEAIQSFNSEISAGINDIASIESDIDQELENLKAKQIQQSDMIDGAQSELEALEKNLEEEPKRSLWERLRGKEKSSQLLALESEIEEEKLEIKLLKTELKTIEAQIECAELRSSGESCENFVEKLKTKASLLKGDQILEKIKQTIENLITLLVSLVLTTIILPLTFLFGCYWLFKWLFSTFAAQNNTRDSS